MGKLQKNRLIKDKTKGKAQKEKLGSTMPAIPKPGHIPALLSVIAKNITLNSSKIYIDINLRESYNDLPCPKKQGPGYRGFRDVISSNTSELGK